MASGVSVTLKINQAALNRVLTAPDMPVAKDMVRRGRKVTNKAKQLCPVDTGRLRSSISYQLTYRGNAPIVQVGTNVKYAVYVHSGTGIYGPKRRPIVPKRTKFLRFKGSNGKIVYVRSVKGMKGTEYLVRALPEAAR